MEQIEIIDGIEYVVLYDEKGKLIYRHIKNDDLEPSEPLPYIPTQLDLIQANVDYLMAVTL